MLLVSVNTLAHRQSLSLVSSLASLCIFAIPLQSSMLFCRFNFVFSSIDWILCWRQDFFISLQFFYHIILSIFGKPQHVFSSFACSMSTSTKFYAIRQGQYSSICKS